MNSFAHRVSFVVTLAAVALAIGACSSADSSSTETGTSRQDLLCESAGLLSSSCNPPPISPIHFPLKKPVVAFNCTSSPTCWVWPRAEAGWDNSYPNDTFPDPNFATEMTAASCGPEQYMTLDVPQTNQDHFEVGLMALCASVPTGTRVADAPPPECGCPAVPAGYTLVYWQNHGGQPTGTCTMGSCFQSGEPPPSKGLPGEPLPDQQD